MGVPALHCGLEKTTPSLPDARYGLLSASTHYCRRRCDRRRQVITIVRRQRGWFVRVVTARSVRSIQATSLAGAVLWAQQIFEEMD